MVLSHPSAFVNITCTVVSPISEWLWYSYGRPLDAMVSYPVLWDEARTVRYSVTVLSQP